MGTKALLIDSLNPAFQKRQGTNVHGQKDALGKLFRDEIIKTAETTAKCM
jgi:hypothetical protein